MRPYIDIHTHLGTTINRDPVCGQSATKILARASQSGVVAAVPSAPQEVRRRVASLTHVTRMRLLQRLVETFQIGSLLD